MKVVASLFCALALAMPAFAASSEHPAHWDVQGMRDYVRAKHLSFTVGHNWVTDYLANGGDIRHVTGYVKSLTPSGNAHFFNLAPDDNLPKSFDWRTQVQGGMQPIRNQGNCGSCWAFSVTAVLESLERIAHPEQSVDLAEQALVSCSSYGSCDGGDFDAFNYMQDPGMPNESQFPYRASDVKCKSGLTPTAKVATWAYVGDGKSSPTTDQIKTAIRKYGPVSVDVYAAFGSYNGGIFDDCTMGDTDHMVTLEGWNDDGGYWIMRNSWGQNWGENGYMRIKYTDSRGRKCNNIGATAAFAVLNPAL